MVTMSIAVRELTLADHAMVDELREAVAADLGVDAPDRLAPAASGAKAFLTDSGSFVFGAYVDHEVAGGVWGSMLRHPGGEITVEARELYVLAGTRRRGIGTLLIESSMGLAKRLGATTFEVRSTGAAGLREACELLGSSAGHGSEQWAISSGLGAARK